MVKDATDVAEDKQTATDMLSHIEVELEALLGEATMTISQLNALSEGDLIKLDRQVNENVSIKVNERIIGRGEIVTIDDRFAVRLTQIGD